MDFAALKRRADAAREFTVDDEALGGRSFTLRLPTPHEFSVATMRIGPAADPDDRSKAVELARLLVTRAVVGWAGVTEADLVPGGDGGLAIAWHLDAVPLLFDHRPEVYQALFLAFSQRRQDREQATEAAAKN